MVKFCFSVHNKKATFAVREKKKKVAGKTTQIELIKFTLKQFTN